MLKNCRFEIHLTVFFVRWAESMFNSLELLSIVSQEMGAYQYYLHSSTSIDNPPPPLVQLEKSRHAYQWGFREKVVVMTTSSELGSMLNK